MYAVLDLFVDIEHDRFWWWHGGALTASLLTALFVFLTARGFVEPVPAALIALAFGLGSCAWPVSSQALWQHPASTFFLSLGAWLLLRSEGRPLAAACCGAALGMAVLCRPTVAAVVLCTAAYLLCADRRRRAAFVPAMQFVDAYSYSLMGWNDLWREYVRPEHASLWRWDRPQIGSPLASRYAPNPRTEIPSTKEKHRPSVALSWSPLRANFSNSWRWSWSFSAMVTRRLPVPGTAFSRAANCDAIGRGPAYETTARRDVCFIINRPSEPTDRDPQVIFGHEVAPDGRIYPIAALDQSEGVDDRSRPREEGRPGNPLSRRSDH